MDDQLKARLIGAAILVALAVLLIPELLSGRKPVAAGGSEPANGRATRTVVIDLTGANPGQAAAARSERRPDAAQPLLPTPQPESVPATEPSAESVTAARSPAHQAEVAASASAPGPTPSSAPAVEPKPAPPAAKATPTTPPPAAEPRPSKAAAKGGWVVQVGAFGSTATAGKLVAELKGAGYPAFISPISKGGKTLQRVRVGPVAERAEADKLAGRLKGRSLPATVVAND